MKTLVDKIFCFTVVYLLLQNYSVCKSQSVLYNEDYNIACHNCFEPQYANNIEEVFLFTTAIELDIWDTRRWFGVGGWKAMNQDWYVRHIPTDKGNVNCCGGSLKDCLNRVKSWSDLNPNHKVITVFIDKKENWSDANETRKPSDLDQLLKTIFSSERIITPSSLLRGEANLKEAVLKKRWLSLDEMKGKIAFVITKSTEFTQRNVLNEYLDMMGDKAICFVAPEIISGGEVESPGGISQNNASNVVFYNLKYNDRNLVDKISSINCMSRIYGSPETANVVEELISLKVNFIASFNYRLKVP